MLAYSIRRVLMLIPVLFGMSILVFSIIYLIPGNPAQIILGQRATVEAIAEVERQLGLDQPWYVQYFDYVGGLLQGDLGTSIKTKSAISSEIFPYLAATAELTMVAMVIAIIVGVNAGIISAWLHHSWFDYIAMVFALIGVSMPIFWLGLMEQYVFSVQLDWLPSTGRYDASTVMEPITHLYLVDSLIQGNMSHFWDIVQHLILPGIALATIPMAIIARITRSSMLEVMNSHYIRTARAKGLHSFLVVYKHSLKNAVIPVLTVIGLQAGLLLGGAILTETIFGWPGIGRYIYDAINYRDYPVIQSGILLVATIFVLINVIVDLLYAVIDPRIKYHE
ncbi:ABC transporter permease [Pontibacillus salicampi]|uniref:ABC transporter permease n=1 Tax=Pontibacillus salicampi TaxID=1449801 RepID=A0ABV6LI91_9BACI